MSSTNRSWPGTSTNATSAPGRQRRPGEAEVDGHAAAALLGPPVGLHPGQRAHQRRLAVVDVPRGRDDVHSARLRRSPARRPAQRRRRHVGRQRAQVEQAAAVARRGRRPRGRRRAAAAANACGQRDARRWAASTPGAPPPPTVAVGVDGLGVDAAAASRRGQRAAARARSAGGVGVERRRGRRGRPAQGGLQRGEGQLVDPQRAGQRVPAQRARPARAARRAAGPACGPPSSLSPLAVTRVGAVGAARVVASGSSGSSGCGAQQAGADVGDDRHAPRPASSRPRRPRVKPVTTKFDGCTLSTNAGVRADGVGVVGERDPVGGADLAQPGAGRRRAGRGCGTRRRSRPARRGLTTISRPAAERGGDQRQRGGAVVDHVRGLGGGHGGEQRVERAPAAPRRARRWPRSSSTSAVAGGGASASTAAADSGARPRLVCSSTPVALSTGRRRGRRWRAARRARRRRRPRGRSRRRRTRSCAARDRVLDQRAAQPLRRRRRAAGRRARRRCGAPSGAGRRHVTSVRSGAGPAEADGNRTRQAEMLGSPVLKTARATRHLNASAGEASQGRAKVGPAMTVRPMTVA